MVSRLGSSGLATRLLAMDSGQGEVNTLANEIWDNDGSIAAGQNSTWILSASNMVAQAKSLAYWRTEYPNLPAELSTWTQLIYVPRDVYFESFNDGSAKSFAMVLFGCTALLFARSFVLELVVLNSIDNSSEPGSNEDMDVDSKADSTPANEAHNGSAPAQRESMHGVDPLLLAQEVMQAGASSESKELCTYVRTKLQPMVEQLRQTNPNSEDFQDSLLRKAAEYLHLAKKKQDSLTIAVLEGKYGESSFAVRMVKMFRSRWGRYFNYATAATFIIFALVPCGGAARTANSVADCPAVSVFDVVLLAILTAFNGIAVFVEKEALGWCRERTLWIDGLFTFPVWVVMIVDLSLDSDLLVYVRPVMFYSAMPQLHHDLLLFVSCVWEIRQAIAYYFTIVILGAHAIFILYCNKLDGSTGDVVTDYYEAFVRMYIFIDSGDNWEGLIYNVYSLSYWGALFFFPFAIIGIFFLFSMVLALFQMQYDSQREEAMMSLRARYQLAVASTFILCTQYQEEALADSSSTSGQNRLRPPSFKAFMRYLEFGSVTCEDLDRCSRVDALTEVLITLIDQVIMQSTVVTVPLLFCLQDGSAAIELSEFSQLLVLGQASSLLNENLLLAHKVILAQLYDEIGDAEALLESSISKQHAIGHQQLLEKYEQDAEIALTKHDVCEEALVSGCKAHTVA